MLYLYRFRAEALEEAVELRLGYAGHEALADSPEGAGHLHVAIEGERCCAVLRHEGDYALAFQVRPPTSALDEHTVRGGSGLFHNFERALYAPEKMPTCKAISIS